MDRPGFSWTRSRSSEKSNRFRPDEKLAAGTPNISTARLALGCFVISASLIGMLHSLHSQTPADDVSAQIRSQGYQCDQPVTAKRDVKSSRPDLAVWILKCGNAAYRVRLVPNMAAHVRKLK
jgi:hypothetical protein